MNDVINNVYKIKWVPNVQWNFFKRALMNAANSLKGNPFKERQPEFEFYK